MNADDESGKHVGANLENGRCGPGPTRSEDQFFLD